MIRTIPLGVYFPGESILHRLQARTKLLILLWFMACVTIANNRFWHFAPYIVFACIVAVGMVVSRVSPRQIWMRIWPLLIFSVVAAIPTLFTSDTGYRSLFAIGPVVVSLGLLRWILLVVGALIAIVLLLSLIPLQALRSRSRQRRRVARLPLIVFMLVVFAALWLIRNVASNTLLPLGPFVITDEGVWLLVSLFAVFLILYTLSLLLTMTTPPIALIEGLTMLLSPLRRLRLPVDDFALMALLALRFIPTLFEEFEQLMKAQMSRGADYAHGSIRQRIQSLIALFVPLMKGVLRRAGELATALEARGYEMAQPLEGGAKGGRQTLLYEGRLARVDYMTLLVVGVVTVGVLFV